eukprot:4562054-Pleurochrysis_carterae.AAC.3
MHRNTEVTSTAGPCEQQKHQCRALIGPRSSKVKTREDVSGHEHTRKDRDNGTQGAWRTQITQTLSIQSTPDGCTWIAKNIRTTEAEKENRERNCSAEVAAKTGKQKGSQAARSGGARGWPTRSNGQEEVGKQVGCSQGTRARWPVRKLSELRAQATPCAGSWRKNAMVKKGGARTRSRSGHSEGQRQPDFSNPTTADTPEARETHDQETAEAT